MKKYVFLVWFDIDNYGRETLKAKCDHISGFASGLNWAELKRDVEWALNHHLTQKNIYDIEYKIIGKEL